MTSAKQRIMDDEAPVILLVRPVAADERQGPDDTKAREHEIDAMVQADLDRIRTANGRKGGAT